VAPDDGVQRVLRTGIASAGSHGVSIAVWTRSGKVFAEARVFARGDSRTVDGIIETLKVEADESDLAVVLLGRKVEEKYGQLNRIHWWPFADTRIKVGQRVWVLHPRDNSTEKVGGVIASVGDGLLGGFGSFVVRLDDRNCLLTCALAGQGTRWDFAMD
jgi:hypothetical protein